MRGLCVCRARRTLTNLSPLPARWTVVTPMSSNRSAAGVTVFEGRIYVSGGHDGLQIFNSVSLRGAGSCKPRAAINLLQVAGRPGWGWEGSVPFPCAPKVPSVFAPPNSVISRAPLLAREEMS